MVFARTLEAGVDETSLGVLQSDGGLPRFVRPLWASTVYVKRGGKWLIAFHQEIPAAQAK